MEKRYFLLDDKERQKIKPKGSSLRVLFNLDPYCARIRRVAMSRLKVGHELLNALRRSGYFNIDYRFFGSNAFLEEVRKYDDSDGHFVYLKQSELLQCFDYSFRKAYRLVFLNSTEETPPRLAESCRKALGEFVPDIIFAFGPTNYLKYLHPESAIIHCDSGFVSRAPYPRFWGLDPLGHQGEGVLGKYWDKIQTYDYSEEEIQFARWVWKDMFIERQRVQNPIAQILPELIEPGKKLFLIATQNSEWYNFYGSCDYDDEIHFINHTMSQLPDDCRVIITMHPWSEQKLRVHISDLAAEDVRIINDYRIYDVPMTSQSILPFCDGVICLSSGVGIQAKMWGVPLACPGESHLTRLCDTTDVSKLHEFDSSPEGRQARRDEIIPYVYFAAARQSVHERDWYEPEHLVDIVLNWLDCSARNAEPLTYFERLGNRDFQKAKETVLSNLVDLTPERLEVWRRYEKGLLKKSEDHNQTLASTLRRFASRFKSLVK